MFKDILRLSGNLKYEFNDINILKTALTHSSYVNEHNNKNGISNERLEFLGDAVLDLIVGEYFFYNLKNTSEGKLSKLRSSVVNEETLFEIGVKFSIGDYMRFGKGELKFGGKKRKSIIADCLEAIIGAVFIDGGYEATKKVVLNIFKEKLIEAKEFKLNGDYKSRLQEILQKTNGVTLNYNLYNETGPDNDKVFYSEVRVNGEILGRGSGSTKKLSEQMAAKEALVKLGEEDV
ncbi:ribonuclease III [Anaerosphaera multitolerans]|uniref:Ribonuclease 3 n=1 Tax=Anaerosphaera multitolerans TaxID=2487351 RepID=A0A437S887_9FIRM|nr:ribonuclease III [Anaerosphaera multitolerans]RVU55299.1 ribonuclease III [Anaerosphaera multitolerans]